MKFIEPKNQFVDTQFRNLTQEEFKSSGFFLFQDQGLLLDGGLIQPLRYDQLPSGLPEQSLLYVGALAGKTYFTAAVENTLDSLSSISLRYLMDEEQSLFQLAGRARQLINWEKNHRYCGRCGEPTLFGDKELVRVCHPCDLRVYPRLSPCVIMLVHRGDQILLAQRPGHQSNWYTVQAGFIEAGESAEQAVVREVMEETGLTLTGLRYFDSQPWPFPGQLMLGYFAENLDGELQPDPEELVNADWFDYRDLPEYPGPNTLSGKLIRHFISERDAG